MSVVIQKRPYRYCFSGNPVHYELYSALAAADPTISLEIRLMFKNIGGAYAPSQAIPYDPIAGIATVDAQDLLDGLLEFELPHFSIDELQVWSASRQTGEFYLQYREITALNPNPSWDDSESDYESFVVKGGISRWKYQGNNFWVNYFFNELPFLTWQRNGRLAAYSERMYLAWLNDSDGLALGYDLRSVFHVYYTDGTSATGYKSFSALKGVVYYCPAGAAQWNLQAIHSNKTIWYWTIQVLGHTDLEDVHGPKPDVLLSEVFKYYLDNRNNYNDITLSYRNSLGGLDSARIRGVIDYNLDYDYTEQATVQAPDYFDGDYFTPAKIIANCKEKISYKGDIGYLPKEEQDRLRDVHVKRETWWEVGKKWWPMNVITKNNKHRSSIDQIFSTPIEFTHADMGDNFYTPMTAPLGDGSFTSNVCQAQLADVSVAVDTSGADAQITINGTEVDPQNASTQFRFKFLDNLGAEVLAWTIVNYLDLPEVIHLPKGPVYTLLIQAICANTVYGKKSSQLVDTSVSSGGGGGNNSAIVNTSPQSGNFTVDVDAGAQNVTGHIGANSATPFNITNVATATVVLTLDFSPPSVSLISNGVTYSPSSIVGNVITFLGVNIVGGITIVLS
jgi:hypothetical protein